MSDTLLLTCLQGADKSGYVLFGSTYAVDSSDNDIATFMVRGKTQTIMREMRKCSRARDAEWALEVFDKAPYVTVSMTRPDGTPYGLPLSLVRSDRSRFYFHCADEGEKIDCLKMNPTVSLSAVSRCSPKFEEDKGNYTEHYRSAIAVGKAEQVTDDEEKIMALRLLCQRFLPNHMDRFDEAIRRSLSYTTVIRITLTEPPVGKCKE